MIEFKGDMISFFEKCYDAESYPSEHLQESFYKAMDVESNVDYFRSIFPDSWTHLQHLNINDLFISFVDKGITCTVDCDVIAVINMLIDDGFLLFDRGRYCIKISNEPVSTSTKSKELPEWAKVLIGSSFFISIILNVIFIFYFMKL